MRNLLIILLCSTVFTGCSVRRFAMNRVADALASSGSTFESDNDPELVAAALPFGLKLYESMLAESPKHQGLLLAACKGFTSYSFAYVHDEGARAAEEDVERARPMLERAQRLYQRALAYCQRSLEVSYPGIGAKLAAGPRLAVQLARRKEHVPNLYWTAVTLGLAISVSKNDPAMLARVPEVEALAARAAELDDQWEEGTLHEFQVTFSSAAPGEPDYGAVRRHYDRTLELSRGRRASVHVAFAEAWALPQQNRQEFEALLRRALEIDPNQHPPSRLLNILTQKRARWLMGRMDLLFGPGQQEAAR